MLKIKVNANVLPGINANDLNLGEFAIITNLMGFPDGSDVKVGDVIVKGTNNTVIHCSANQWSRTNDDASKILCRKLYKGESITISEE